MNEPWDEKTLEALEGKDWGEATYPSHLLETCHRIRRKRLRDLTIEELRLAIGQKMGLEFLLPLAIRRLSGNPLAESDFFPGDRMLNVLRVPREIWNKTPALQVARANLHQALGHFFASAEQLDALWKQSHLANFQAAHRDFMSGGT